MAFPRQPIPFTLVEMMDFVNPKQTGLLKIGMAGGGQVLPLCNFCLNDPIDLKFGMWIVHGKISRYRKKIKKMPGSCSKC